MIKRILTTLLVGVLLSSMLAAQSSPEQSQGKREKKKRISKRQMKADAEAALKHQLDSLAQVVATLKAGNQAGKPAKTDSAKFYTDTIINWLPIEKGVKLQTQEHKKILVYVYAKWCKWCKLTEDSVFKHKEIAHYINQNYIPVSLHCEDREPHFFKGMQFNYQPDVKRNIHELSLYLLNNKQTYPGFVILDTDGNILDTETGYMDPAYLEMYLNYYATNAYLKMDIKSFDQEFGGKIKY